MEFRHPFLDIVFLSMAEETSFSKKKENRHDFWTLLVAQNSSFAFGVE